MRLEYILKSDAQAKADAIHQWLIANIPPYAESVLAGQTVRWDTPNRAINKTTGLPEGNEYITVKDKCLSALTTGEKTALIEKTPAAVGAAK